MFKCVPELSLPGRLLRAAAALSTFLVCGAVSTSASANYMQDGQILNSPDGRYAVKFNFDAPSNYISVYRRTVKMTRDRNNRDHRHVILKLIKRELDDCIGGARWAPHRGHTFVFAIDGVYGDARLAVWTGGKRAWTLVPRRFESMSGLEGYELDGFSKDGNTILFGYWSDSGRGESVKWFSYRVKLARGSKSVRDHRVTDLKRPPPVFDANVITGGD